jgi:hypothetical protein
MSIPGALTGWSALCLRWARWQPVRIRPVSADITTASTGEVPSGVAERRVADQLRRLVDAVAASDHPRPLEWRSGSSPPTSAHQGLQAAHLPPSRSLGPENSLAGPTRLSPALTPPDRSTAHEYNPILQQHEDIKTSPRNHWPHSQRRRPRIRPNQCRCARRVLVTDLVTAAVRRVHCSRGRSRPRLTCCVPTACSSQGTAGLVGNPCQILGLRRT